MTIREWMEHRLPAPPEALTRQIIAILGTDAEAHESALPEICLAAGARALGRLVAEGRFGRDTAVQLLAIDALTTYAFEYASQTRDGAARLQALTERGALLFGQLTPQRV